MQTVYYIFDTDWNVIAIFKDEEFARDYLYHLGIDEEYCKKGMLGESVFKFEEHDAKYYSFKDSSLNTKMHKDCRRFKKVFEYDEEGYCFFMDEKVYGYNEACSMIEVKK